MLGPVFDGADFVGVGHVAGHAHHKDIAHALVENDFDRNPGIGARKDCGHRMLAAGRSFMPPGGVLMRSHRCPADVAGVAFFKAAKRFVGTDAGATGKGHGCRCHGNRYRHHCHRRQIPFHQEPSLPGCHKDIF